MVSGSRRHPARPRRISAIRAISAALLLAAGLVACDGPGGGTGEPATPKGGTVVLGAEDGVVFATGQVQAGGSFKTDLYATPNGSALRLASGGSNIVDSRPVNWFLGAGGKHEKFASLDEVPDEEPAEEENDSLLKAETGHGFVLLTAAGTYVKGFLASADAESVTIEYVHLP